MTEIKLRPYQQKFIDDVRTKFKAGSHRVCGVAPCGAGKTIMTGWMIKEALQRGKRSIFLVHRKELIEQTANTFTKLGVPFGIVSSGFTFNPNLPVQIAGVQTLIKRLDKIPAPNFIICDECHHILSKTYLNIIKYWRDAYLLGVTATPQRLGGINLGDVFNSMVCAPTVKDLINLGNLTEYAYFSPAADVNFHNLRAVFGDYDQDELENIMSNEKIVQGIVDKYLSYASGKSCICYCVNVNHSKKVARALNDAGIPAAHCDGETNKKNRANIVKAFRAGLIKVLCNAELFGEGFDVPNMDAVILARPTKSLTLHIQQSMRPMRPDANNPEKVATIIDYVKNFEMLGLPDTPHTWSLEPNPKKTSAPAPFKICPKCKKVVHASAQYCPKCGFKFPISASATEDVGVLEEVSGLSIEHFLKIAQDRGYKSYWAVFRALEVATTYDDIAHIADVMNFKKGWVFHKWNEFKQRFHKN